MFDHFLMNRRAAIFHDSIKNAKAIELLVWVCVIQSLENVRDCFSSFDFVASDHVAKLKHSLPVWFEQGVGGAFVQELFEVGFENTHSLINSYVQMSILVFYDFRKKTKFTVIRYWCFLFLKLLLMMKATKKKRDESYFRKKKDRKRGKGI